jgi:hypothetical protein
LREVGHADVLTTLVVTAESLDPLYNGLTGSVLVVKSDVYFPVYLNAAPLVSPLAGQPIVIIGGTNSCGWNLIESQTQRSTDDFLPGMSVLYAGVPALSVVVLNQTHAATISPSMNVSGYVTVTLVNPDGGWSVQIDGM